MRSPAHILIVEDERLIAKDLERRLKRLGYTVVALVATGHEAIQQALQHRPDVVLMDIRLQGTIDGIEAAESIHLHMNTLIIYLSAYVDAGTLQRAEATHPAAFLRKPFNEHHLHQTLQRVLSP